jgi:uncharacterized protein YcfL
VRLSDASLAHHKKGNKKIIEIRKIPKMQSWGFYGEQEMKKYILIMLSALLLSGCQAGLTTLEKVNCDMGYQDACSNLLQEKHDQEQAESKPSTTAPIFAVSQPNKTHHIRKKATRKAKTSTEATKKVTVEPQKPQVIQQTSKNTPTEAPQQTQSSAPKAVQGATENKTKLDDLGTLSL